MPESRTPAVSRLQSQGQADDSRPGSTEPQGPTKAKPSKPAGDTSDEGLIEDSDDNDSKKEAKGKTPKASGNKLSVFQKKKSGGSANPSTYLLFSMQQEFVYIIFNFSSIV